MSTYSLNYAIWTGAVGVLLQAYKQRGFSRMSPLFFKGFVEKAGLGLISSYLQMQNLPLVGVGLDANYIYNGILGALSAEIWRTGKTPLSGAEEQILCALIGHRLAANFGRAFDAVSGQLGVINNMFAGSSGYQNASIPDPGTGIPSQNSGNNTTMAM